MVVDTRFGVCFTRSNFPSRFNTISDPNDHDIYKAGSPMEREKGGSEGTVPSANYQKQPAVERWTSRGLRMTAHYTS